MKKILLAVAVLFSTAMMAQDVKPTFEQFDDLIKGTYYYDTGEVRQQGFYENGKLQGTWISYDRKGKKIAQGQYDQGGKTGKWFFWSQTDVKEVDYTANKIAAVNTISAETFATLYDE